MSFRGDYTDVAELDIDFPIASGAAQESDPFDNTVDDAGDLDRFIAVEVTVDSGSLSATPYIDVYGTGSIDGTDFGTPATGAKGAITPADLVNIPVLGEPIEIPAAGAGGGTYRKLYAIGGSVLPYTGVILNNRCGLNISAGYVKIVGVIGRE